MQVSRTLWRHIQPQQTYMMLTVSWSVCSSLVHLDTFPAPGHAGYSSEEVRNYHLSVDTSAKVWCLLEEKNPANGIIIGAS